MANEFFTILTAAGRNKLAAATATATPLALTQMAVGDGDPATPGGAYYNPTEAQTTLKHEVWRGAINHLAVDANNPNWIVAELVIPDDVGGFYIREVGLFDSAGAMIAVGKFPESYKPTLAAGSNKQLYVRMILEVSNTTAVTLLVDPSVVLATRQYCDDKVADELNKRDGKQSVRVATTAAIALAGLQTIDGVVLVAGDRVLVKDQAAGAENGIYVAAVGAWVRATDADSGTKLNAGALVPVEAGTVNADTIWMLKTDGAIIVGATPITFQWAGGLNAPTQAAGDNSAKVANTAFVQAAITALVASSPAALDTLNELAAALGNDASFATTVTNMLASKATPAGIQSQTYTAFTTTGATGAFVLTPNPAITAYSAGQRFRVKFHADGTFGSDVINISTLGDKSVKQYSPTGAKVAAIIKNGQLADIEYDGVDLVILDPLPGGLQSTLVPIGATTTLTAADCGKSFIGGSGTAFTLTLPLSAAARSGSRLEFTNMNAGVMTVARQGADIINMGQSLTSINLGIGDTLTVESNAGGMWYVVSVSGCGVGQTWQNVSGSRALNTNYTNTTGRPIMVAVSLGNGTASANTAYMVVGGVTIYGSSFGTSGAVVTYVCAIVPPGATYAVGATTGTPSIYQWDELR